MIALLGTITWAALSVMAGLPAQDAPLRALATQFADGRTTYRALSSGTSKGSWTPLFPRVVGVETSRNGLPLAALDVSHTMQGEDALVTVTLVYGRPHQQRIPVGTVQVSAEQPVRVDQLTAYGVQPITLSIVPVPDPFLVYPSVATPSNALDAVVEMAPGDSPSYLIAVVNRSDRAVRGIQVVGERGGRRAISGYRKAPKHTMLIEPGEAFMFPLPATMIRGNSGGVRVLSLDRLAITSVAWSDGSVEGEEEPAVYERFMAAGTVRLLGSILALFRAAGSSQDPQVLSTLRADITSLPVMLSTEDAGPLWTALRAPEGFPVARVQSAAQLGMQQTKELVLRDLSAIAADPARAATTTWLAASTTEYQDWLQRAEHATRPAARQSPGDR